MSHSRNSSHSQAGTRNHHLHSGHSKTTPAPSKRYSLPDNEVAAVQPEVVDRYFGSDSKLAFAETYRQLKRQGEIHAGGYAELHDIITGPVENNLIHMSILEMESCGVLTPRVVSLGHETESQLSSLTVDADVASTATGSARLKGFPGGKGYVAAKQLSQQRSLASQLPSSDQQPKKRNFLLQSGEEDGDTFLTKIDSEIVLETLDEERLSTQKKDIVVAGTHQQISAGTSRPFADQPAADDSCNKEQTTNDDDPAVDPHLHDASHIPDGDMSSVGSLDFRSAGLGLGQLGGEDEDDLATVQTYSAASPRAIFINGCLREKVPPITLALIRKNISTTIDLSHMGIGDRIAHILAQCLSSLPYLQKLILSDNNLEDEGLAALIRSASKHKDIEVLDISSNIIGFESATALGEYLGNAECKLKCLRMRDANIDDVECAHMVSVLMHNTHLQEFDLSKNILGKDENLNVVKPSFVTGGESLAALLLHSSCPLEKLILHWNMIRLEGAIALCQAMQQNKVLTHLDLSYNAVGSAGAELLGQALMENNALRHLNLSHNNIDPIGCFTLCSGVADNQTLEMLLLDGNPLGELGGKMLAKVAAAASLQLNISAQHCDLTIKTKGGSLFDLNDPFGEYDLDMSVPYHRAVLIEALRFTAENPTATITHLDLFPADGPQQQSVVVPLARVECQRTDLAGEELFESQEYSSMCELNKIHDSFILNVLQKYDMEGLEQVSVAAIDSILYDFNVELSEDTVAEMKSVLDPFDSRFVDIQVLTEYLKRRGQNAVYQLQNIQRKFVMTAAVPAAKVDGTVRSRSSSASGAGTTATAASNASVRSYTPPVSGRIKLVVAESSAEGADAAALQNHALPRINARRVIEAAESSTNSLAIIMNALESCGLYLEEALTFFNHIYNKTDDAVFAVSKLLPQMVSPIDGKQLVKNCLGYDMQKLRRLKQKIGPIYFPLVAMYSGYYRVDFSTPLDRRCWKMLLARSKEFALSRTRQGLGELSQHGDGVHCFRNIFEHSKLAGGVESLFDVSTLPKSGKVEFDFIDYTLVDTSTLHPMTDEAMIQMLHMSCLLDNNDLDVAMKKLRDMLRAARKSILCAGNPHWKPDLARATGAGKHTSALYRSLALRWSSLESISKRETLEKEDENDPQRSFQRLPTSLRFRDVALIVNAAVISASGGSGSSRLAMLFVQKFDNLMVKKSHIVHLMSKTAWIARIRKIMRDRKTAAEFKSVHLLEFFTMELRSRWLHCRQLALLVELFEVGTVAHSKFGSYRVQLIVLLFDRIVDLHNFSFILQHLTAQEHAAVCVRIGILNFFNPCAPEGAIQLDLARWDERQIVKMLVHLSCVEPGENWRHEQYSFERQLPPIPGWELKVTWFAVDGLPSKGVLTLDMFSGDGMNLRDCLLDRTLRNMLQSVVLVSQRNLAREIEEDLIAPTSAFNSRIAAPFMKSKSSVVQEQKANDSVGRSSSSVLEPHASALGSITKNNLSVDTAASIQSSEVVKKTGTAVASATTAITTATTTTMAATGAKVAPPSIMLGLEEEEMRPADEMDNDDDVVDAEGNIISLKELRGLQAQIDIFKLYAVPAEVAMASSYTYHSAAGATAASATESTATSPLPVGNSPRPLQSRMRTFSPKPSAPSSPKDANASTPHRDHDRFSTSPVVMSASLIRSANSLQQKFRQYTLADLHRQLREKTEIAWTYSSQ